MKKYLLALTLLALATGPILADYVEGMGGSTTRFSGTITAIETDRDSITVESEDKIVKMFTVSPSQKSSFNTGDRVTVSYVESYDWPLKSTSITGGSVSLDK